MERINKLRLITWVILITFVIGLAAVGMAGKKTRKGYLGVSVERLSRDDRRELKVSQGVVVVDVSESSPADKAGILEDDVIQTFNGVKIRRPDDLVDAVRETTPKSVAKVTLVRDGSPMNMDVTVGRLRSTYSFGWGGDHLVSVFGGDRGYLGVSLETLNDDLGAYFGVGEDGGALIVSVSEESPAEEAGIKGGDVIIAMDDVEVMDPIDVHEILSEFEEGETISVTVLRQKSKKNINVELGEHPSYRSIQFYKRRGDTGSTIHIDKGRSYIHRIPEIEHELQVIPEMEDRLHERLESMEKKARKKYEQAKVLHEIKEYAII